MRYEIEADLDDLQNGGVDLRGLYVIRRKVEPGQRRFAGRINQVCNGTVELTEVTSETSIGCSEVQLEGTLDNFSHFLKVLLGNRYIALHNAIDDTEAAFRVGPALDDTVDRMGEFMRRKSPFLLGEQVQAEIGNRLSISNNGTITSVYTAPPVEYVYDRIPIQLVQAAQPPREVAGHGWRRLAGCLS